MRAGIPRRRLRRIALATALACGCAIGLPSAASAGTKVFGFTGGEQTFTVPVAVSSIHVVAVGARGGRGSDSLPNRGGSGGRGDRLEADLAVTPGQTLFIEVGGTGASGANGGSGGFNGGGDSGPGYFGTSGGGGGGASDVRTCSALATACPGTAGSLTSRLLVAAGGGGGGDRGRMLQATGGEGGHPFKPGGDGVSSDCAGGAIAGYGRWRGQPDRRRRGWSHGQR